MKNNELAQSVDHLRGFLSGLTKNGFDDPLSIH
jgi:hypothetical protein